MKYVWIVEKEVAYEGTDILGVFDSEDKASDFVIKWMEDHSGSWEVTYERMCWSIRLNDGRGNYITRTKYEVK